MLAFDPASYVKTVLAPVAAGASLPDMFARYLLEPGDKDTPAIERRMAEVKAHWDKLEARNNAKYGELVAQLIHEHRMAELILLSEVERRQAAEQILSERAEVLERRKRHEQQFEQQLTTLLARANGLTDRDRHILEEFARSLDLDPAAVAARLDRCPVVAEHSVDLLPDNVRHSIRKALSDYAAAVDSPSRGISLFHALELPGPEYDPGVLKPNWERLADRQRTLNVAHRAKTSMATVLSLARVHLIDSDPAVYGATMRVEVREALRPRAARAAIEDEAIDELEAEQLVRAAQESGVTAQEARDLVAELARDLGVKLQLGAAVDYVACANCNRPFPSASAPERCTGCGEPLFWKCQNCGTRCAANDRACSNCGTDLAAYVQSLKDLSDARLALESGRIELAASMLGTGADSKNDESKALQEEVERRLRQARSEWSVIERAISERRLFTAVVHLDRLESAAADVMGPAGILAAERRAVVADRLRGIESLLTRARGESGQARERSFAKVLEQAVDCIEAKSELERVPPLPVSEVQTLVDGNEIRVSWKSSSSPGPVSYRVTRSSDHTDTGAELELTSALTSVDREPPAGESLRYGVVSERAGSIGTAVFSAPCVFAREIENLAVSELDGEIHLTWKSVGANARVEVERTDEDGGKITRLRSDSAGLVDRDVRNGTRYRYRVWVAYSSPDGHLTQSKGTVLFGTPSRRPEPVRDLRAEWDGARVRLRFTSPQTCAVSVLSSPDRPDVHEGEELTPEQLTNLGEQLQVDAGGVYDPNPSNVTWYLPVSQAGAYLLAGRAIRYLSLPQITDVRALDLGESVRVTWSWPAQVRAATVAWRRDRQPIDAQDERAERLTVTQAQYDERGGVELDAKGSQPVFLAVFAAARIDGELMASSATDRRARLVVGRPKKVEVNYAVRRSGLRKRHISFEVITPDEMLPELVIVAKRGELLPRSPSDGRVIAQLGGPGGPREQGFDLADLGRPIAVRLFLGSTVAHATYHLRDPETRELVFR